MARPRLIFSLLYADGYFHVSRNFNLQAVGNLAWLLDNYEFDSIARAIDELVILNVSRHESDSRAFIDMIHTLARRCFMPIAIGGRIRTAEQAATLFSNGADKVILNSAYVTNPALVHQVVTDYGAQSVVASVDFRRFPDDSTRTFIDCGRANTGLDLTQALAKVVEAGAGELYLTSIDMDGTGQGYDLRALETAYDACSLPLIASGGAETYDRLVEGIQSGYATAVSTSHLFNFIGDGLRDARNGLVSEGVNLTEWNFETLTL